MSDIHGLELENPLHAIVWEMRKRGGSFVNCLAEAMLAADPENLRRIVRAFPEIIGTYDGLASVKNREARQ
jgi:hypothetical protein